MLFSKEGQELDYSRLIKVLQSPPSVGNPVILPDFFLDHFVVVSDLEEFIRGLRELAAQGGGNLLGSRHLIRRGGNSVNTASALLSLGVLPKLIVKTDPQGLGLLQGLVSPEMDLSHVKTDGRLAATVSIEANYEGRRVNLMVSDSGSVATFSFSDLVESDLQALRRSNLVALLCLNHNKNASDLARALFTFVRRQSKASTFIDMGDPSNNPRVVTSLADAVLREGLVDTVSMNENEAGWFARALAPTDSRWTDVVHDPGRWLDAARFVSRETGIHVDLHTPHFTATVHGDDISAVPAFVAESRVVCGAGDSWNAGDIYGMLLGLQPDDRLVLANAVAALYVSSAEAKHPSKNDLISFLKSRPLVSLEGNNLLKVR